ncbi:LmbE family protein [Gemmatirosa kalamazoonensis]|uniref:LmbE family protein n=1 Tax=Gemmatirosa kalamazoonensis TaxID=861299 RepID=W0RAW0_9BACT|nr:PIG-L family deacetylase [Gemmatirosa kalamazoonensis]AHG87602.1 LmbE family protein [Gemmatirosa kalamazoonensis]
MKRLLCAAALTLAATKIHAQDRGAAALGRLVDGLGMTARVLVIAAHPDDEDTRLITLLAKGRHAETGYLSLTRGDGGQNLIGNELGEALGAIRTEELLAARRLDGGRQFFARAFDFGFSKSAEETFQHWPHDSVLGDVVKIVRAYRPQVVIAIWSGTPADGHGHHQASGIIAREAYDLSADTVRFPTATYGAPWAVPKFYRSTSYRGNQGATLRYDAGRYDPLLGRSYAEIAAESRSQHKSQGQGGLERKGPSIVSLRREASRVNAGTPAERERDLFDGVDTTAAGAVAACTGTASIGDSLTAAIRDARRAFDAFHPETLVAPLVRAQRLVAVCAGTNDPRARLVGRRVNDALLLAAGVAVDAEAPREVVAFGDTMPVTVTVYDRGTLPVQVRVGDSSATIAPDSAAVFRRRVAAPTTGGAWWLARPRDGDMFTVPVDVRGEEVASRPPTERVDVTVGGAQATLLAPIVYRYADAVRGDVRRPLVGAPAVSVTLDNAVEYARAGVPFARDVHVRLRSASTAPRDVTVRLELPNGLAADSAARRVTLPRYDAQADVAFHIRGTIAAGTHAIRAVAESNGERFTNGYQLVDYDHIRPQRLYRVAETRLSSVGVTLPPKASIAYVQGVGDNVAPMLAELGLPVTMLDPAAIASTDLSKFTAIVIGQRAYEASDALLAQNPWLFTWVRNGGTLVVQGGQAEMQRPGVMPFPIVVAQPTQRVTHPDAPVTVVDSTTSVLASPNRIDATDWQGWVQERARYLPRSYDSTYKAPLSMADPGEPPSRGALLVAPYGRGTYVYTTLSLFRQLPNGNPGAARLFVNLLGAKASNGGAGTTALKRRR